jgi:hypothetical protein
MIETFCGRSCPADEFRIDDYIRDNRCRGYWVCIATDSGGMRAATRGATEDVARNIAMLMAGPHPSKWTFVTYPPVYTNG